MADSTIVTLRLPKSLVERADRLIPQLRDDDQMMVVGRVSRSIVLRLAVLRGLESLERGLAGDGTGGRGTPTA
ncbi:MAG: hypothetical protein MJD61_07920 [Proteobacteria bacterium]|nr:hypothetical protein [Pseudomonadota bacterium]